MAQKSIKLLLLLPILLSYRGAIGLGLYILILLERVPPEEGDIIMTSSERIPGTSVN